MERRAKVAGVVVAAAVLGGAGAVLARATTAGAPEEIQTSLFGVQGHVLRDAPPVAGFAPEPLPEGLDVWGASGQDPGPGRRIGIWAPVPLGTEVVGLEVDGRPVAWQRPAGPGAVLVFDQPGRAELVAYDADGTVIDRYADGP